jgi:hypothetical protein
MVGRITTLSRVKTSACSLETLLMADEGRPRYGIGKFGRVDARAVLPVSGPVVVLRTLIGPELRGKPVRR